MQTKRVKYFATIRVRDVEEIRARPRNWTYLSSFVAILHHDKLSSHVNSFYIFNLTKIVGNWLAASLNASDAFSFPERHSQPERLSDIQRAAGPFSWGPNP